MKLLELNGKFLLMEYVPLYEVQRFTINVSFALYPSALLVLIKPLKIFKAFDPEAVKVNGLANVKVMVSQGKRLNPEND